MAYKKPPPSHPLQIVIAAISRDSHQWRVGSRPQWTRESREIQFTGFYVLQMTEDSGHVFFKHGVTTRTIEARYATAQLPYTYEVLLYAKVTRQRGAELESWCQRAFQHYTPKRSFGGSARECTSEICLQSLTTRLYGAKP